MASDVQRAWNNAGKQYRPPNWARGKLTPQQRDTIRARAADGEEVAALALEYGVSTYTIRRAAE